MSFITIDQSFIATEPLYSYYDENVGVNIFFSLAMSFVGYDLVYLLNKIVWCDEYLK